MSSSEDLRQELAAISPERECDRLAELSALFHTAGRIHLLGRGLVSVHLDLGSSAVARRAFSLLRAFEINSEIRTYRRRAFDRSTRFQLHVPGEPRALQVLNEAGVLTTRLAPLERPPRRVVSRACCRRAYVRGALLGAGSLSARGSPHLELRTASREGAEFLVSLVAADGVRLAVHDRGRDVIAYAKGREAIASTLALAGASSSVIALEERSVLGATRSQANRLSNSDHANLVRTSRAAHAQLRAVKRLTARDELSRLEPRLREAAELRVRYPSLPLRELAGKCDPPATKTAVYRRLRKLVDLAG